MESVCEFVENIMNNRCVVFAWAVVVIVILVMILYSCKEKFLNEGNSALIATQRSPDVLGIGQNIRFSSEFSGTNQSQNNVITDLHHKEHMTGSPEPIIINEISQNLAGYQGNTASTNPEAFSNRPGFIEGFNNTDSKLRNIMNGY